MDRGTFLKVVGAGALVLGLGFAGGTAVAASPVLLAPLGLVAAQGVDVEAMPRPSYDVNSHGETFGSVADARSPEEEPDLIQAVATNGKTGYVRKAELDAVNGTAAMATFTSPQDALAWQSENAGKSFTVPVYLEDGRTVIGEFLVTSGDPKE